MTNHYDPPAIDAGGTLEERVRLLTIAVRRLYENKHNATGTFTLTADATSTTVNNRMVSENSIIQWSPLTASAGGELGMRYTAAQFSFTIYHASDSRTDRTFGYTVSG
jgi:hypothetical protein